MYMYAYTRIYMSMIECLYLAITSRKSEEKHLHVYIIRNDYENSPEVDTNH